MVASANLLPVDDSIVEKSTFPAAGAKDVGECEEKFGVSREKGMSTVEVLNRNQIYRLNALGKPDGSSIFKLIMEQFMNDTLVRILLAAAVISAIGIWQEPEKASEALKEIQSRQATYFESTALAVITIYLAVESMNVQLPSGSLRALLCFMLVVSCTAIGASNKTTIHSPDGDIIDCINIKDQPTFKDPLMKHHKLQEMPTDMLRIEEGYGWQVWHAGAAKCPKGTIPVRRSPRQVSRQKRDGIVPSAPSDRPTPQHQYATAYIENQIYGTQATMNVWDPIVEAPDDFSLAQVWLASGHYVTNDVNSIEAGWQVSQSRYGDRQPRFFTYWTRDGYLYTGCYSLHCSGFVQISRATALEGAITRISTVGGDQFGITIKIWKDRITGNWWLGVNDVPVRYWPTEIFTSLADHADMVEWVGEVLYKNSSGMSPINQMGSGEFAENGFKKAAYFCYLQIADGNLTFQPVQELQLLANNPKSYRVMKYFTEGFGNHFYYGGPGPGLGLRRSTAVPRGLPSLLFMFFAVYLVV